MIKRRLNDVFCNRKQAGEMTIKEANYELKRLENEYNYWLNEKEQIKSLVVPKSTDIRLERVDGGKREDKLVKYAELLDDKKIDETLDYIDKKRTNLMNWLDQELKIMEQYEPLKRKIIRLREEEQLSYEKIGIAVGYSTRHVIRIYKEAVGKRNIY